MLYFSRVGCRSDPADNSDWLLQSEQTSDVIPEMTNCLGGDVHVVHNASTSEQVLGCFQRPHDQFLHRHEERAHRERQGRCFRYNVVHFALVCVFLQALQALLHQLVYVFSAASFFFR